MYVIPINISADRKSQADDKVHLLPAATAAATAAATQQPDSSDGEDDATTASPAADA